MSTETYDHPVLLPHLQAPLLRLRMLRARAEMRPQQHLGIWRDGLVSFIALHRKRKGRLVWQVLIGSPPLLSLSPHPRRDC